MVLTPSFTALCAFVNKLVNRALCGAIPELERALEHIQGEGQLLGLHLNLKKCVFWGPPAPLSGELLSSIPRPDWKEGIVLLGCPLELGVLWGIFFTPCELKLTVV